MRKKENPAKCGILLLVKCADKNKKFIKSEISNFR